MTEEQQDGIVQPEASNPGADENPARTVVEKLRPERGLEFTRVDAPAKSLETIGAEERRTASGRELAVEEDR